VDSSSGMKMLLVMQMKLHLPKLYVYVHSDAKISTFYFLNNSVKNKPILIIEI